MTVDRRVHAVHPESSASPVIPELEASVPREIPATKARVVSPDRRVRCLTPVPRAQSWAQKDRAVRRERRVTLEKRDHAAIRAILVCLANPDFPA